MGQRRDGRGGDEPPADRPGGIASPVELLRRYGLRAKKSWGQCFLHEISVIERIVTAAGIDEDDIVVEIGAGLGTLTAALATRARRVIAIERDRDLAAVLRRELAENPRVEVREENALTFDFSALADTPVAVVGNLPYNIASPLLFHLLQHRRAIRNVTVMLQAEVAERLVAEPGSRAYGIPSLIWRQAAEAHLCFMVRSGSFVPRPRVDSAVVKLIMREGPLVEVEERSLRLVLDAAFGHRRKTLRRALAYAFPEAEVTSALAAAGLDGTRRGETLSLEEFARLTRQLLPPSSTAAPVDP